MSEETIETMKDCKHPDCGYRARTGGGTPYCKYLLVTGHSRGCDISVCNKFKPGKIKAKSGIGGLFY